MGLLTNDHETNHNGIQRHSDERDDKYWAIETAFV